MFVTLIGCVLFVISLACFENYCLFVFTLNVFTFFFDQSLLVFVSKIQKHIKSRKCKKFDQHFCVMSHAYFSLYLRTNGFVHLRA